MDRFSVFWDVAGALNEWQLDAGAEASFLDAVQRAGIRIHLPFLLFHRLAYAAFRMGQTLLCANAASTTPAEQARLRQAYAVYRDELARLLRLSHCEKNENTDDGG